MSTQVTAIIPTLNRPEEVRANVYSLISSFDQNSPCKLKILLSDNASDEHKRLSKSDLEVLQYASSQKNIDFQFIQRNKRLTLGQHMHILARDSADWQLWIGDDDCLSPGYIQSAVNAIQKKENLTAIFSNFSTCSKAEFLEQSLHFSFDQLTDWSQYRIFSPSSKFLIGKKTTILKDIALRGHQLSGLFIKSSIIHITIDHINPENLYPWITYMGHAAKKGDVLQFHNVGIAVTSDTPKHFSYRKDGLQPEIIEACSHIPNLRGLEKFLTICKCAASRKTVWRVSKTSDTRLGQLKNYASLLKDDRIPLYAWTAGFIGLIRTRLTESIRFRFNSLINPSKIPHR